MPTATTAQDDIAYLPLTRADEERIARCLTKDEPGWPRTESELLSRVKAHLRGSRRTPVFILTVETRSGGAGVSVHPSKEAADAALYAYVAEEWDGEVNGGMEPGDEDYEPIPEDPEVAVQAYFEKVPSEGGTIIESEI